MGARRAVFCLHGGGNPVALSYVGVQNHWFGEGGGMKLTVDALAKQINEAAPGYEVGDLQRFRARVHRKRARTRKIFHKGTIFDHYAFHDGGRTELQYNIGLEEEDGDRWWRHGVAFSFERSQTLPDPSVLIPKVERFNCMATREPRRAQRIQNVLMASRERLERGKAVSGDTQGLDGRRCFHLCWQALGGFGTRRRQNPGRFRQPVSGVQVRRVMMVGVSSCFLVPSG